MKYLTHEWVNTVLIVLVGILVLVGGQSVPTDTLGATGTRFPNGLSTNTTSPVANELRTTTLTVDSTGTFTGVQTFTAEPVFNAGQLKSSTNATTSVTTGTLRLSDVQGYDTVLLTPTGAAAAKTLTFFASSTASAWLPAAGDRQDTCFFNSTSTSGVDIVFAAGTGIDLEVASSSVSALGSLRIGPDSIGCFTFVRQPSLSASFDITAAYVAFEDGD